MASLCHEISCAVGEGLVGTVWKNRRPEIRTGFETEPQLVAERALECGLTWSAGWPVISHGEVQAVCVFMD